MSKILYIDDENDETTAAIADGLRLSGLLDIELKTPLPFKDQKQFFVEKLKDFDALILDLRLDGRELGIEYNAPAIAQELRMASTESLVKSLPIILCSTEAKMQATYDVDKTSHDLFDYKFQKQSNPPWEKFSLKIDSLAKGYKLIEEHKYNLVEILERNLESFNPSIFEKFVGIDRPFPTHEYASFVIKELFHHPGLLIKERLLAARMGIDIDKSEGWIELIQKVFSDCIYTGVFSDGWKRWWADLTINRFKELTGERLAALNATERVDLIMKATGVNGLVAAEPIEPSKSTNYWTICEFHKRPLDPLEGFKIHTSNEPKSWQENKYISLDAVLSKRLPKPHSSELERIEQIKENIKQR